MLTADLVRPLLELVGREIRVAMLDEESPRWQHTAEDLIALFQGLPGATRATWEQALEAYEGTRLDYPVVRGMAKVLSDAATWTPKPALLAPAELRKRLSVHGPAFAEPDIFHPCTRGDILAQVAAEIGMAPEAIEDVLFADRAAEHTLTDAGPAWTPQGLIARYNLELARGVLYSAVALRITFYSHYKDVFKYLKLFKLMFWATPLSEGGYRLDLAGPISPFVQTTTRYGRAFAAFMPAVLLCDRWQFVARVRSSLAEGLLSYRLDHTSQLCSHFKASGLYDSRLEAEFAEEFVAFQDKFGEQRGHWVLHRESEVLPLGDTVMIPDFLAQDADDEGRRILIELVGYWSPTYLARKVAKVRAANCQHLLLLVYEGLNVTAETFQDTASEVLFFKHKPVIKDVMATIERMAEGVYGPRQVQQAPQPPQRTLAELVEALVGEQQESMDTWMRLSDLEARLKRVDASFSPRRYEQVSLSALVKAHPEFFEVRRATTKGRPVQVRVCEGSAQPVEVAADA